LARFAAGKAVLGVAWAAKQAQKSHLSEIYAVDTENCETRAGHETPHFSVTFFVGVAGPIARIVGNAEDSLTPTSGNKKTRRIAAGSLLFRYEDDVS
jgi:hypothetical protein